MSVLLLTLSPTAANASPSTRPTNMREWYDHVKVIAKKYNLDPYLCLALAAGESGKGKEEVRFCWVGGGRWHGPYNIARCFSKKWDIADWKVNTEVGIMTLHNKLKEHGTLWKALRHYNTGDGPAQFNRFFYNILRLKHKYEERRIYEPVLRNHALKMTR